MGAVMASINQGCVRGTHTKRRGPDRCVEFTFCGYLILQLFQTNFLLNSATACSINSSNGRRERKKDVSNGIYYSTGRHASSIASWCDKHQHNPYLIDRRLNTFSALRIYSISLESYFHCVAEVSMHNEQGEWGLIKKVPEGNKWPEILLGIN